MRIRRGAAQVMVVSLTRMLKSFGQAQDDLPTLAANNAQEMGVNHNLNDNSDNVDIHHNNEGILTVILSIHT